MNREEQQAREIDSIRRALERKPEPRLNDTDWLRSQIDTPKGQFTPIIIACAVGLAMTALVYAVWPSPTVPHYEVTRYTAPAVTPRPQITYAPTPAPIVKPQPTPSLYVTTTRPTPAPQVARTSYTQHHPTPAPTPDPRPQHASAATSYLMQKKGIYLSPISTTPVSGWEGRYRSIFEIRRNPSEGMSSPRPRRFSVLTQEQGGTITGIDVVTNGY